MEIVSLNGMWRVHQAGETDSIPAAVPGCIHTDLLAAEIIPDPFVAMNELDVLWVGDAVWVYSRTFDVPEVLLGQDVIWLRCHGLDTLASIEINGHPIGRTDNMFRTWLFDIRSHLVLGENRIEIRFDSAAKAGKAKLEERWLNNWGVRDGTKLPGVNFLRKAQCHFGWDWGPMLATCGIWRDIELVAYSVSRIEALQISQDHADGRVALSVAVDIEASDSPLTAVVSVRDGDQWVKEHTVEIMRSIEIEFEIVNPKLWWPNQMGDQHLYEVEATLFSPTGDPLDSLTRRIGLRTLRLVREPDEWGESFYFEANGVPFFAKGGNWIPADPFLTRIDEAQYTDLMTSMADANMNMVRVWGGGIYESDYFYDLCDELGLCVWQDFMFACAAYPVYDAEWMATVAAEARDNVRRIRHHASLALWCGNNELEQGLVGDEYTESTMSWADYARLFEHLLLDIVAELDPDTDYWPGSPHSPLGDRTDFNNPRWGDAHLWSVWHGKEPFEWYRTCEHRFNSEFGFQSFPEPLTVASYVTDPADQNITSAVMEHHQRSGIGNQTIIHYMLDWFKLPHTFDDILWLSQITQGMAMKYAVEHWRRSMPRGMGTLYWQINDCWPVASWSSIDYFGRWKALHYMAKRFNGMLLLSGLEEMESGRLELHLTNDHTDAKSGVLIWELWTTDGDQLEQGQQEVVARPLANTLAKTLDYASELAAHSARNLIVFYRFEVDGLVVSQNMTTFGRPKHLNLQRPTWSIEVREIDPKFWEVDLKADQAVLWAWIDDREGTTRADDAFFHLRPGESRTVRLVGEPSELSMSERFSVRSLIDLSE